MTAAGVVDAGSVICHCEIRGAAISTSAPSANERVRYLHLRHKEGACSEGSSGAPR